MLQVSQFKISAPAKARCRFAVFQRVKLRATNLASKSRLVSILMNR